MRLLRKGPEPPLLLAFRKTPGARYDGLPSETKRELREQLLREQFFLCAYCMERIAKPEPPEQGTETLPSSTQGVKIEHHVPQTVDSTRELDWTNLLASCLGGEGSEFAWQHCDTRKGNQELTINPQDPTHIDTLWYSSQGELRSTRADLQADINERLNLNLAYMRKNRREAAVKLLNKLGPGGKGISEGAFQKALLRAQTPGSDGSLPPYAGYLEWLIKKRLSQKRA